MCADHDALNLTVMLTDGNNDVVSLAVLPVRVHHRPEHEQLARAGMWVTGWPKSPVFEGDAINLNVYANTDAQPLEVWQLQLRYDPSVLTFVSAAFVSAALAPPCTSPTFRPWRTWPLHMY